MQVCHTKVSIHINGILHSSKFILKMHTLKDMDEAERHAEHSLYTVLQVHLSWKGLPLSNCIFGCYRGFQVNLQKSQDECHFETSPFHTTEICIVCVIFSSKPCPISPQIIGFSIVSNPKPAHSAKSISHVMTFPANTFSLSIRRTVISMFTESIYLPSAFPRKQVPSNQKRMAIFNSFLPSRFKF